MTDKANIRRLSKVARELNLGIGTIADFLSKKGYNIQINPNTKIDEEVYNLLLEAFQSDKNVKEASKLAGGTVSVKKETITIEDTIYHQEQEEVLIKNVQGVTKEIFKEEKEIIDIEEKIEEEEKEKEVKKEKDDEKKTITIVGKIDLESLNLKTRPDRKSKTIEKEKIKKIEEEKIIEKTEEKIIDEQDDIIKVNVGKLEAPTIVGKIDLPTMEKRKVASSSEASKYDKKRRKRIRKKIDKVRPAEEDSTKKTFSKPFQKRRPDKPEVNQEDIQTQIKETLARLSSTSSKSKTSKYRKAKREAVNSQIQEELEQQEAQKKIIKVTEFVTANQLANLMSVQVNDVISACMSLGLFVSINQRLDAETLTIVAEEFGYKVEFISAEVQENITIEKDNEDQLVERPPIVTVMGHVDHGKTSLLDFIRKTNVIAGEAGGITQHIGAYNVTLDNGKKITFLDTPGHEAFTAMRARGAQVTDIAIIIIAADDNVMPQTIEAINHAQAAGVPMIFAINKIDKPGTNVEKIKESLANMNLLVEDWGGKYQCQEISAKKGIKVEELLEKVLFESEMLDLKANPDKNAVGTVIESTLDKGRGYVTTILVEAGTLRIGDIILAGCYCGKVKAMHNERGQVIDVAGPSIPVSLLGIDGACTSGDKFHVMDDEREARQIATKRLQLQREQGIRTQKHITLDEIGRRLAIGNFKELNVIVKGDVDGSIEALSDSLLKLSTQKIHINIIHKSVGQISESDVLLASASDAIIIGFQVRPSLAARKLAEKEQIDLRLYSVIYDAINEVKSAMEGMLTPTIEEKIVANVEIREIFKVSKVGTVAGCMVTDGKITKNTKVRIVRDGIVVYTGELASLKRFKEDVKEVTSGYECGLNIKGFNDIKTGDVIEGYIEIEVKQTLK